MARGACTRVDGRRRGRTWVRALVDVRGGPRPREQSTAGSIVLFFPAWPAGKAPPCPNEEAEAKHSHRHRTRTRRALACCPCDGCAARVAQADPSALAALRRHSARRPVRGSTGVRPGHHPPYPASRLLLAGGGVWLACSGFSEDPKRILDTVPKFSQMLSSDWPPLNLALA